MQAIGGLIDDIIVLGIFIYFSLLVSGKIKLRQERQEKFDAMMERRGTLFKILAYGGTIIFAALILIGIFSFKDKSQNAFNVSTQPRQWTQADKDAMTKACIENAKNSYAKDPVKTTSLCECVTEKFTAKYTYDQAQELGKKSRQEQMDSAFILIKSCMNDTANTK
ncbi:hypothetical protein FC093_23130 [Ilyomonas limi]|jgi:hypothetical protein|uniref:Uncharacterized protein n=1 Tax=Ilyomonas limi TaxID=2575867 RepID=A0A4V5UTC4_9BACT|nr:hypothetical protein [Ilyomonas limi]TKK64163.1 hypothetical protein FC093_23130 [Ilyomonas limi]